MRVNRGKTEAYFHDKKRGKGVESPSSFDLSDFRKATLMHIRLFGFYSFNSNTCMLFNAMS